MLLHLEFIFILMLCMCVEEVFLPEELWATTKNYKK